MKGNYKLLKYFGWVGCSIVCIALLFLTGCNTQKKVEVKDEKNEMQTITQNDTPFACNMSALDAGGKKRVLAILGELKSKRQEIKELPDGFAFRYAMDDQTFKDAAEFITLERLCCPFFEFELVAEKENGAMWLQLKGREGVKDFIRIEFEF
jgi:hypothetical protein